MEQAAILKSDSKVKALSITLGKLTLFSLVES